MFGYLTNVDVGGNTAFPFVGAFIKPVKQSVALWWNMDNAGGYDQLTRHSGCPVLSGNKWVFNKWIHMNSQMFKRPCPPYTKSQVKKFQTEGQKFQKGYFYQEP